MLNFTIDLLDHSLAPIFLVNDNLADASSYNAIKILNYNYYMISTNGPKSAPHNSLIVTRVESIFIRVKSDSLRSVTALSRNPPKTIIILFTYEP